MNLLLKMVRGRFILAVPQAQSAMQQMDTPRGLVDSASPVRLVRKLLVPVQPKVNSFYSHERNPQLHLEEPVQPRTAAAAATHSKTFAAFCNLPAEIHLLICGYLDDPVDLACLGSADQFFWGITQEILMRNYASYLGRWAGEQLVCVGQGTDDGDYPPALFSAEDLEKLDYDRRHNVDDSIYGGLYAEMPSLFALCRPPHVRFEEVVTIDEESCRVYDGFLRRCTKLQSSFTRPSMARRLEIENSSSAFEARDQAWILRNLTTKEFVTAAGIALDEKLIDGPFIRGIGFGEVVTLRTLWTSKPLDYLSSFTNSNPKHRGVWAGHRFDITTQERHDKSTKDDEKREWKDVSMEVALEVADIYADIYKSEHGADWREECIKRKCSA